MLLLVDAGEDKWERRWFVLRRPYLHMYARSNEQEEIGVVSLSGVNVENDEQKEALLGVCSNAFSSSFTLANVLQRNLFHSIFSLPQIRMR